MYDKCLNFSDLLLAGVPQDVVLKLNTGSHSVPAGNRLALSALDGVSIFRPDSEDPVISLPETEPYQELEYPLSVVCPLDDKGTASYEKRVSRIIF